MSDKTDGYKKCEMTELWCVWPDDNGGCQLTSCEFGRIDLDENDNLLDEVFEIVEQLQSSEEELKMVKEDLLHAMSAEHVRLWVKYTELKNKLEEISDWANKITYQRIVPIQYGYNLAQQEVQAILRKKVE